MHVLQQIGLNFDLGFGTHVNPLHHAPQIKETTIS